MALVAYGIGLALIWVLAWGTPTPANVLGGLAVAAVLMVASPDTFPRRVRGRVRPVAIGRFVGYVLVQVVTANVQLTRAILSRDARLRTAVLAVRLPACSEGLLTLVTNTMAVTPGTMPIEVTRHPTVVYFHALLIGDLEDARRGVEHLAGLAYRAFGSDEAIAALDRVDPAGEATS
jgi:multicomponent Na+:H+ antiporter subunit E